MRCTAADCPTLPRLVVGENGDWLVETCISNRATQHCIINVTVPPDKRRLWGDGGKSDGW
jgi:hypothetical protein